MGYGITGYSSGHRQSLTYSLKAGQFRGMGRTNMIKSNTTIINNFGRGYGFGMGGHNCHCNCNSTPKWMNWMMGIGMGTSFLGNILSMFGIGGGDDEGAGSRTTTTTTQDSDKIKAHEAEMEKQNKRIEQLNKEIQKMKDASLKTNTPPSDEEDEPIGFNLQDGSSLTVHDAQLGAKADITGTVKITGDTISVRSSSSGTTFNYQAAENDKTVKYNGKTYKVYHCVSAQDSQGNPLHLSGTDQEYIFYDGKFIQPKELDDKLSGLGSGTLEKTSNGGGANS